ncbi:MAG: hypothetical protein ABII00_07625 [Elusimicrobiota bacterium]
MGKAIGRSAVALLMTGWAWRFAPAWAEDVSPPWTLYRMETDIADRIQSKIMDRILGLGQSSVFVAMGIKTETSRRTDERGGTGTNATSKGTSNSGKSWTKPQDWRPDGGGTARSQAQTAEQSKQISRSSSTLSVAPLDMSVRVLYNAELPERGVKAARRALIEVYAGRLKESDVSFVRAPFQPAR